MGFLTDLLKFNNTAKQKKALCWEGVFVPLQNFIIPLSLDKLYKNTSNDTEIKDQIFKYFPSKIIIIIIIMLKHSTLTFL